MHKHIIWGALGIVSGLLIGIFAVSTTPSVLMENKQDVVQVDSKMHDSMMESTKMLSSLEGDAFDINFTKEMIDHHQGAIDMAKLVLAKSQKPELKELANNIIIAQTNEILQMERWLGEWTK